MDGNKEEITRRLAYYIRVSTDDQADKFGIPAQREAVEAILKTKGKLRNGQPAVVFAGDNYVYIDDISGSTKLDERPGFAKLKEDYLNAPNGHKPFDTVAVFKIDRFARKLRILMDVIDFFEENGIEFISATESIDTSTAFGRAMLGIMGVIAELERENILDRTRRGREQANLLGVYMGANARYGYQKDSEGHLVIFEEEAKIVRKIFDWFSVGGLTPQKIADVLIEQEILSPDASAIHYGKRKGETRKTNALYFWRMEMVRSILSDEIYTGILYHTKSKKGKPLPKGEWQISPRRHDPIIPRPFFEFTQKRLLDISSRKTITKSKDKGHLYLLSGLLKCDNCRKLGATKDSEMSWTGGKDMIDISTGRYSYHYQCNRKNRKKYSDICPVVPIPAESLEKYVVEFVRKLLANPKATFEYQRGLDSSRLNIKRLTRERKTFQELLENLPIRRQNILKMYELKGSFDSTELQRKLDELNESEANGKKRIDQIDNELSKENMSVGYEASLELYAQKYSKVIGMIFEDADKEEKAKRELYDLIHMLIDRIVVYARSRTQRDRIAGRKKADQLIPDRIDIQLNLPQNLLQELVTQKFGARNDNLWGHWDSNPKPTA